MATNKSLLFVDAYDSFSQNIIALLHEETGADITRIEIDTDVEHEFETGIDEFAGRFDAIVLGPGPGDPTELKDTGHFNRLYEVAGLQNIPILGICLGFQVLCVGHGLRITRMSEPCHGHAEKISVLAEAKASEIHCSIFADIDIDDIWATCYNSLGLTVQNSQPASPVASRPGSSGTNVSSSTISSQSVWEQSDQLEVLAIDSRSNVMAVKHRRLPFWAFQFHPESCKSNRACRQLIRNWWRAAQSNRSGFIVERTERSEGSAQAGLSTSLLQSLQSSATRNIDQISPTSPATSSIMCKLLEASSTTGNKVQWKRLAAKFTRTQISDLVHDLANGGDLALLESTKKGRFSIYALLDDRLFHSSGGYDSPAFLAWNAHYENSTFSVRKPGSLDPAYNHVDRADVWKALESFVQQKRATGGPTDVPFWGGFIGYLSYELGLDSIGVVNPSARERVVPDISMLWVERSIIYDNLTNTVYIQSIRKNDQHFVNGMAALLSTPSTTWSRSQAQSEHHTSVLHKALQKAKIRLPDHDEYNARFHTCQNELRAGNSYELCLTTEATISTPNPAPHTPYDYELYKNLHAHNPVPLGVFMRTSGVTILGTSPEQYMSWSRDGVIDMIPMKGTVKRSADMTFERASAILSSPKESAENLMIADLIRHDLYNAVGYKSKVEVIKLCEVVEHETVYQLVSHIRAHAPIPHNNIFEDEKLKQAIHYGFRALQQTLPPGSMTGAPKKRSCEILANLEQRNRGVYSGVLGYIDVGGGGNWNVCIRTAFKSDSETRDAEDEGDGACDVWHLGAGGAITVLSDAEGEWQEMMVKLNSVLQGFKTVKCNA